MTEHSTEVELMYNEYFYQKQTNYNKNQNRKEREIRDFLRMTELLSPFGEQELGLEIDSTKFICSVEALREGQNCLQC